MRAVSPAGARGPGVSKLISEPPLLVLPSLAREVGLTDAIVLQQLHYAGQRTADGWVERSAADWSRAIRGVLAPRSLERIFPKLVQTGWVEALPTAGKPTAYRVAPRRLAEEAARGLAEGVPADSGGSLSRERTTEKEKKSSTSKKRTQPADEVDGFAAWLEHHSSVAAEFGAKVSIPREVTDGRTELHRRFVAALAQGFSPEEIGLASDGVLSADWNMEDGKLKYPAHATVLRKPDKVQERVDAGRAWRAQRGSTVQDKYAFLNG